MTSNTTHKSTINMNHSTLRFPLGRPSAYIELATEPAYDARKHLGLEVPDNLIGLADLGYDDSVIQNAPSRLGLTSAFRVLSDEGLAAMRDVTSRMYNNRNQSDATGADRLGSYVRGAGYRSKFVRDFCDCPVLLDFLSGIVGARLGRHSVPAVACGVNYAPEDITRAVDTWHVDSVSFDMVTLLSDPESFCGGEFQYFLGTKEEGSAILGIQGEEGGTSRLPSERVATMSFPAAGYGFLQQGNLVFHRACRLLKKAERVTMIPSYVVLSDDHHDGTNVSAMSHWKDPGMLTELARHEAWRATGKLENLIDTLPLEANSEQVAAAIEKTVAGLTAYVAILKKSGGKKSVN